MNKPTKNVDFSDFETKLEELRGMTARMQELDVPLAELIEKYEDGLELAKEIESKLNAARERIQVIENAQAEQK